MDEIFDLKIEKYFLENFNIDNLFSSLEKSDFLFLHYIYLGMKESECEEGVFLSEIAEKMKLPIAAISKAMKRLQEKGYVNWDMTPDKERTYVTLTNHAIELMRDERVKMKNIYETIISDIPKEELEVTIATIKKINKIIAAK